ncbi:MAG: DUF5666 domain-containing protein [Ktedonobacterales bacterium]
MDELEASQPSEWPNQAQQWSAPPDMGPPNAPPHRPRARGRRRWLLLGGGAAALLMALAMAVAFGTGTLSAQAAGLQTTLASFGGANHTHTNGGPGGGPVGGPHMGPGRGALTVSGVSGQTITAERPDGTSVTITVSSSTTYTRAGKTVSLSAISAGETIQVMGQRKSDASIKATRVDIVLPHADGQVASISGSTITIKDHQGATQVIHTSASTTVQRAGKSASLSDIATGAQISAVGTKNSDGSLNAEAISIILPGAGGEIKSVAGSTITVTNLRTTRATATIHVTASTQYVTVAMGSNGPTQSASSFSALKAGVFISAVGTKNSDGSLTAVVVTMLPNAPAGHGGPPMGGPGDHDGPPNGAPPTAPNAS